MDGVRKRCCENRCCDDEHNNDSHEGSLHDRLHLSRLQHDHPNVCNLYSHKRGKQFLHRRYAFMGLRDTITMIVERRHDAALANLTPLTTRNHAFKFAL